VSGQLAGHVVDCHGFQEFDQSWRRDINGDVVDDDGDGPVDDGDDE
jgi:hypothetical protein